MAKITFTLPITGGEGSGVTNLSYTASPTDGTVNSDTGTDASIPLADATNAGLLSPAEKIKLNNTSGINNGDQTSIAGITGTKTQFNTAVTDGDFLFVGDVIAYTDEQAQDAVGNILVGSPTIDFTYDDSTPSISADVKANSIDSSHLSNSINVSEFVNDSDYATEAYVDSRDLSNFFITGTEDDAKSIKTGSITKRGELVIDSEIDNISGLVLNQVPNLTVSDYTIITPDIGENDLSVRPIGCMGNDDFYYVPMYPGIRKVNITTGVIEDFSTLIGDPRAICKGLDGFFYVLVDISIIRIHPTTGDVMSTIYSNISLSNARCLVHATDNNIYIGIAESYNGVAKLTFTGDLTIFPTIDAPCYYIDQGNDGLLYCNQGGRIYKSTLDGVISDFVDLPDLISISMYASTDGFLYSCNQSGDIIYKISYTGSLIELPVSIGFIYAFDQSQNGTFYFNTEHVVGKLSLPSNKVLKTDENGNVIKTTYLEDVQYLVPTDILGKEDKRSYIIYADDYNNLTDAINATPAGGTLILGNHTYTGNISITRGNINIVGSKMPAFHATEDKLIGGTIINGTLILDGNNISISNLGIDSGTDQCDILNSGNPMEGLVMHDVAASDLNFNNTVENVIAIVKANTTMHALLFEGLANSTFRNVHGKGGDFGVVFKVSDSNASEIYGYESRTTNVYIKSDSYAPTLRSNFNNINSLSNAITTSQPVAVHASTSNLFDVNVNNVNIYGGTRQFRLISHPATTPTYVMSNVNVSNVVMENGVDVGLDLYGVVYNSAFNNILVRNTTSGQGVFSDFNGRGINFNNIRFDDNSGNNLDTAIDIRSYSVLNNIVSIRNTDQTSLGGINLNNFANSSKIGVYVGNLKINGVSVNRDKLTGQGTINFLPKYETAGILKNSLLFDNGLDAGVNTASLYTLGAGWTMLNVANSTGSGFVSQVGVTPALRITSSTSTTSINELRNLPLLFGTNSIERERIHPSGGVSIGDQIDPGDKNLRVAGSITLNNVLKLKAYTVATLPVGSANDMAVVTDALAPTYNVTVVGGGAVRIPVFHNGTNWTAH